MLIQLADHIPLKQGLRRAGQGVVLLDLFNQLADHIPLKQGLRQGKLFTNHEGQNASQTIFH